MIEPTPAPGRPLPLFSMVVRVTEPHVTIEPVFVSFILTDPCTITLPPGLTVQVVVVAAADGDVAARIIVKATLPVVRTALRRLYTASSLAMCPSA